MELACWLAAAAELEGVEQAAVITPPVILNVVVPGLDMWPTPAAVTVFTEPSDNFSCAPCELPTTWGSSPEIFNIHTSSEKSPR